MKQFLNFIIYLFYRSFALVLETLPLRTGFVLGQFIGITLYYILPKYRNLVRQNLTLAFQNEFSEAKIHYLTRQHFATLGANLLSSFKLATLPTEKILNAVEIEGLHHLENTHNAVLALSHLGNWELSAQIVGALQNRPFAAIYQPLGNKYIDQHVRKTRMRFGLQVLDRHAGFQPALKFLREGGVVAVLMDQHAGDHGIWTPLFGRLASTSPLAALLTNRVKCPLIMFHVQTTGIARWKVKFSPMLPPSTSIKALTYELNQQLETAIRETPHDWFWVHNRWKTPKPNFLLTRYHRGTYLPDTLSPSDLKPFRIAIRSSNWLGDAVMTLPAVMAAKNGRPDAHITILCQPKLVDFWKQIPQVDAILAIDKSQPIWQTAKKIKQENFEVAIILPNSFRSALEVWLANVPRRVGYAGHSRSKLLNQIVKPPKNSDPATKHQVHHYLHLIHRCGGDASNTSPAIRPPLPLSDTKTFRIAVCPGAEFGPAKRWLTSSFADTINILSKKHPIEWILVGVPKEIPIGQEIESLSDVSLNNQIGKTSLSELIPLLQSCHLLLTNDTGTMHLATALNVPVVAIFGSTDPTLTGPLGPGHTIIQNPVPCSPCFLRECPIHFPCMRNISPSQVAAAISAKLSDTPPGSADEKDR